MEKIRYIDGIGKIIIQDVEYHRNGVMGNGFNVVTFVQKAQHNRNQSMVAIVFSEPGNIAVFDTKLLSEGNIAFGQNSWRGDNYEKTIRKGIEEYWDDTKSSEQANPTLEEMLSTVTDENRHELVDWGKDVGREVVED